jgi:hypothetical protein
MNFSVIRHFTRRVTKLIYPAANDHSGRSARRIAAAAKAPRVSAGGIDGWKDNLDQSGHVRV